MPIQAAPVTPVKKVLERSDPSGDTWVMIRPATYRDDMVRGEFLKSSKLVADAVYGATRSVEVNVYGLRGEELWMTYPTKEELNDMPPCHIVIKDGDKESEPFEDKEKMGYGKFMSELGKLSTTVVLEWYEKMLEVNPGWRFPF